jgi:hypothetical protein
MAAHPGRPAFSNIIHMPAITATASTSPMNRPSVPPVASNGTAPFVAVIATTSPSCLARYAPRTWNACANLWMMYPAEHDDPAE